MAIKVIDLENSGIIEVEKVIEQMLNQKLISRTDIRQLITSLQELLKYDDSKIIYKM